MHTKHAIAEIIEGRNLEPEAMAAVIREIMSGEATDAQIGGFLVALRMKGPTIDEISSAAEVMREMATPVLLNQEHLVDVVGTGGDAANLFNVSTAATFVVAAAGARVAKHGSRAASSASGSSDVLAELGMPLDLSPEQVARAVDTVGMGFMFAPAHHGAMRHVVGPRRELGAHSLFNILGPLTNPARVKRQLLGVFDPALCEPLAEVLRNMGSVHAMVVHSEDGLDEISIAATTRVAELRDGSITCYQISPEDMGLERQNLEGLAVASAAESAGLIRAALGGENSKAAAMIAANAGATIYVSGIAATLADGVAMAEDLLATGQAAEKMREFIDFTRLMREQGG